MKLNQNSISAKLYRWFYMTDSMPTNLCPYFWKLVIAYSLLIPFLAVTLLYQIIYRDGDGPAESPFERIAFGLTLWLGLFVVFVMLSPIYLFWNFPPENSEIWTPIILGCIFWVVAIVVSAIMLIKAIKEKRDDAKWKNRNAGRQNVYDEHGNWVGYKFVEPKPNILVEFIKAKYNKYCPKIDWNE